MRPWPDRKYRGLFVSLAMDAKRAVGRINGSGGTLIAGGAITPALDDNVSTAPAPLSKEAEQTIVAQPKPGVIAGTLVL